MIVGKLSDVGGSKAGMTVILSVLLFSLLVSAASPNNEPSLNDVLNPYFECGSRLAEKEVVKKTAPREFADLLSKACKEEGDRVIALSVPVLEKNAQFLTERPDVVARGVVAEIWKMGVTMYWDLLKQAYPGDWGTAPCTDTEFECAMKDNSR